MWSESSKNQITVPSVDTKKDPLISASASVALNLVTLNVNNDQVNDQIHDIKIKRKTNWDLLSKKNIGRIWRFCWYISCLPGELRLEVDKSVQPVQHMHPVAMKEEIMKKINILSRKLLQK